MQRSNRFLFPTLLAVVPFAAWAGELGTTATEAPVKATILTTLTTSDAQVRQYALDRNPDTFFESVEKPHAADHFTIVLDETVAMRSIVVVTGRPDGTHALHSGTLEISAEGRESVKSSKFADGMARIELSGGPVRTVRITPGAHAPHSLAIREITITSDPPVETFEYPVEFLVDVPDAPEVRGWAEHVAEVCERAYPMINRELKSERFKPPVLVTMSLRKSYRGVAATSGSHIVGSVRYFKDHPHDVGAMIHETVHVVQQYHKRHPGWLAEGVADYVRFFKFEPGKIGTIHAENARYDGSYRVTASFLNFVCEKYDKDLVLKLNRVMRERNCDESIFFELTGKSVQDLDEEWRNTLHR
jgi:hypothetical protein